MVPEDTLSCSNQLCPGSDQAFSAVTGFDLLLDFTDHTGTLQCCALRSPVADRTLGCTVSTASLEDVCSAPFLPAVASTVYIVDVTHFVLSYVADRGVYMLD